MESSNSLNCDFCAVACEVLCYPPEFLIMLQKYKSDQLLWLCQNCKIKKDQSMAYCLKIAAEHQDMKQKLQELYSLVIKMSLNQKENVSNGSSDTDSFSIASSSASTVLNGNLSCSPTPIVRKNEPVAILKDILGSKIKIPLEQQKQQKETVTVFVDLFLNELKVTEAFFKDLYIRTHYTGSAYEKLRIVDPCEYDIDLVFRFPFTIQKLEFIYDPQLSGWTAMKFSTCPVDPKHETQIREVEKHFVDSDGYVSPSKVRQWMQSIVNKRKDLIVEFARKACSKVITVDVSSSGPAQTLKFKMPDDEVLSIDFVPVLEFVNPDWPKDADRSWISEFHITPDLCNWFLVPKPCIVQNANDQILVNKMWRIHFPEIEKKILHHRGCVKPVIKLMKLLRDDEKWVHLASYFLKIIVIWAVKKHPDEEYWNEVHMHDRFMEVLNMLLECLRNRCIQNLFYPKCNLLQKVNKDNCSNMYNRLKKIIEKNLSDFKKKNNVYNSIIMPSP